MPVLSSLLAAQAAALPPASPAFEGRAALAPVYTRLREGRPVHILQIGDSHTTADAVSNGLRASLQARYGQGGRGALAPGRPYRNYVTWQVTAAQSAGWRVSSWNEPGSAPLGLSGFTQSARAAGESVSLAADGPDHGFDRLVVCAVTGPGAGAVTLRLGDDVRAWSLDAPRPGAACGSVESRVPASAASVTTLDGRPVSLTSLAVFSGRAGVTVSNLGQIGAKLSNFAGSSDAVVRAELAAWRPDLILLAFGTNEAFDPHFSLADYAASLRGQIDRLRRLAGRDLPIVLVGPPDTATRSGAVAGPPCGGGWFMPRLLDGIREHQRAAAREPGLAFWDWERAMGGRCAVRAWHAAGLVRDDHVHFNRDGGDRIGRLLFADLFGLPDSGAAGASQP